MDHSFSASSTVVALDALALRTRTRPDLAGSRPVELDG